MAKDLLELMDGLAIPLEDDDVAHFSGVYRRQVLAGVGHNIPQEAPHATLEALLELLA
ncbi:hypothetical protein J2X88_005860 [Pseudomonas extremaustralis]|nr:hypothetical protein [Pseudomonas extremaustralis]